MTPTNPPTGPRFTSRPRDDDRPTRKPLALWDRVKYLLLLAALFWFFVWADMADNPLLPFVDAVRDEVSDKWWIFLLGGLELARQVHYLISEHSAAYHRFWTTKVFGGFNRRSARMSDWTRYRIARLLKIVLFLVILSIVLGAIFHTSPALALVELPKRLIDALPFVFQLMFGALFIIIEFGALFWLLTRGGVDVYYPDDIKTRFSDVWGQDSVLARVRENMVFLEDPEAIEKKGGYVPGGILLWGPPGTGKTLMAEAVAGETGKPYVFVDPGAFINMFMGVGVLKVKSVFRKLRRLALRYGGVIVFFDEADALGNRGQLMPGPFGGQGPRAVPPGPLSNTSCNCTSYLSEQSASLVLQSSLGSALDDVPRRRRDRQIMGMGMGGGGGGMGTLQALLTELSGLKKPRGFLNRQVRRALGMRPKPPPKYRILVMMATNMPQALDEALLRPGRIDRIYKVGYPSKAGRVRTYEGYLDKVRHELTSADVDKLATITPYATGATIKDLVNEALIVAIRNGREVINWRDVVEAKQLKDLGPPEDVEYIERERHATALHEACHAVVAYRARHHLVIDIATIEKGGTYLGMVSSIKPDDLFTQWRSEYEADVMVSLASLAGEKMFFDGDSSSGVSGDLESATTIATFMEGFWGMGSTVSSHGVTHQVGIAGGGRPGEQKEKDLLKSGLGERIEENLEGLLQRTESLLADNSLEVLAVTHALETNKTLTGDDIKAVVDGTPGPLVDGTEYHSPEFAEQAREYHRQVVIAHKEHASVDVAMPTLNGQRGPDFVAVEFPEPRGGSQPSGDGD
ncbi:MAG TPA: AAA family ATPase [Acidimicrobiia bacterium]|nr:AAA family ATPase [Acidimicrobiia bacterium]